MPNDQPAHRTPLALIVLAWLIVCIPAAWGVTQTVMKSLDLFKPANTPSTAPSHLSKT